MTVIERSPGRRRWLGDHRCELSAEHCGVTETLVGYEVAPNSAETLTVPRERIERGGAIFLPSAASSAHVMGHAVPVPVKTMLFVRVPLIGTKYVRGHRHRRIVPVPEILRDLSGCQ